MLDRPLWQLAIDVAQFGDGARGRISAALVRRIGGQEVRRARSAVLVTEPALHDVQELRRLELPERGVDCGMVPRQPVGMGEGRGGREEDDGFWDG